MEKKKKPIKLKKSEIEEQYEEFFNYIPRIPSILQPEIEKDIQTWTTYGVGQFEVLLKTPKV